ncbi:relaxase/mobilization nuclease domain-containing protein [Mucilaginibacter sp. Bleaf8]|uniref:relaxase/mobilization nuclease domain-containing protein n=1 Tax=Mucilaginibacter sp. Bleaf8 TaxID=2834430 RepID=UPI001BCC4CBA|nr:relaxase/mobilization nuclease domain-containing protein [Mucilaginibacter sp. Bleaf8]MBS7566838.1 relaxase/mobilization nuclease domain-containing protein [Mucilaginibacter sp. Bleaf8]
MIGKVKTGRSFGGCIGYVISKHQAQILEAVGVRTTNRQDITDDFNAQRKLNPALGQAVGHIALSWSVHDRSKLTPELMIERAKEYLDKMQIWETQYLIVQHQDKEHPHIHIIYNRVDNEGSTISDRFQKQRNAKVCKELTLKHGYHMGRGKVQVNRQRLTGDDKIRYELYDALTKAAKQATCWTQLEWLLGK